MNLLFVCTGNTCRSPLAEAIGNAEAHVRGLKNVACASAGMFAPTGERAAAPGIDVAAAHGLDLDDHISQPLNPKLLDWADYLVGMDQFHVDGARHMGSDVAACLLTHFLPEDHAQYGCGVPDPYGGDFDTYKATYGLLEVAVRALFDSVSVEKEPNEREQLPPKFLSGDDV